MGSTRTTGWPRTGLAGARLLAASASAPWVGHRPRPRPGPRDPPCRCRSPVVRDRLRPRHPPSHNEPMKPRFDGVWEAAICRNKRREPQSSTGNGRRKSFPWVREITARCDDRLGDEEVKGKPRLLDKRHEVGGHVASLYRVWSCRKLAVMRTSGLGYALEHEAPKVMR